MTLLPRCVSTVMLFWFSIIFLPFYFAGFTGTFLHIFRGMCVISFLLTMYVLLRLLRVEETRNINSNIYCAKDQMRDPVLFESTGYVNVTGMNESVQVFFNPPGLCQNNSHHDGVIVFLVIISSAPNNFRRRKAIRESWLSREAIMDEHYLVVPVFQMGQSKDKHVQLWLEEEAYEFGDSMMYNVRDIYQYLTLKTLVALSWADRYCAYIDYVVKVDDDAFLHLPNLYTAISVIASQTNSHFILGYLCRHFNPPRNRKSKWYLPPEQFSGNVMPTFTAGWCYVMPRNTLTVILRASENLPLIRLEDVYVTGMCREKSGVRVRGHPGFRAGVDVSDPLFPTNLIACHGVGPHDHITIWDKCKSLMLNGTS